MRSSALRGRAPALVLSDSAAARSLVGLIAILTFLAGLATAGAEIVAASSREWQASVSGEATIQLRPQGGRDIAADLGKAAALARAFPGIAEAREVSASESERLLEPWLGRGLDLGTLPIPRLVVLRLGRDRPPDLRALAERLSAEIPGATLDDHGGWRARLSGLANTLLAAAVGLVCLVLLAAGLAVGFATRGAMAGSREIVDVLQLVGAGDRFIVREFRRRIVPLAAAAACAGGLAASCAVPLLIGAAELASGTGPDDALVGTVSLGGRGYGLIALVSLVIAVIAAGVSVVTAKRFLRTLRVI